MAKNAQDKEQARLANAQKKKEQSFRNSLKKLAPYTYAALGLLVAALLLFFTHWLEIYNTDIPGVEIGVSGFSAAICGLTGNYTLPDGIYGMMGAFYYWVPGPCPALGVTTLIALAALVVSLVLVIVALGTKKHALDVGAAVLSVVSTICLVVGFVLAKGMEPDMIAGYCSGNPACSLKSYALIPAFFTIAAAAVCVLSFRKYLDARKKLQ